MNPPRRRRAGRVLLSGAVAMALLLGAAQAGLAVPSEQVIRGVAAAPALDYAGLEGSVAPLSDAFVAQVLGLDAPEVAGTETAPTLAAAVPGARTGPQPVVTAQGPSHAAVTHEATNDDVADAYRVSSVPFSARTDASDAGREPGEPEGCAPTGPTLWYRYDAPLPVGLSASTVGTSGVVALAVFVGDELDELRQVGCHVDVDGEAQVSFPADAGATYLFQVTLPAGGGPVGFNLDVLGTTTRISDAESWDPGISADGRYVVFNSYAAHYVRDLNGEQDVYLYDRRTGTHELVSVSSEGRQGNAASGTGYLAVSDDGRYVAFFSAATNLVPGDTNGWSDVFVRDRVRGRTERVSVSSSGAQARAPSDPVFATYDEHVDALHRGLSLSADGRVVAFESDLVGLVPGDVELEADWRGTDVFVHDRTTGRTEMVSVSSDGAYADDWSDYPSMSADGRYVAFRSYATNLTHDPMRPRAGVFIWQRGSSHVYLHDRVTGQTELVSRAPGGEPGDDESWMPSISADGRHIAFASWASNFVTADDNASLDVFVADRHTGSFHLVSISTSGEDQTAQRTSLEVYLRPGISRDGRYVVFDSEDPRLEAGDTNGVMDVFVHDRIEGRTFRVSKSSTGAEGDEWSGSPVISADGRHVVFISAANTLEGDPSPPFGSPFWGAKVFVHSLAGRS